MINTNHSTTENYTQEFKHWVVDIFSLCISKVLLTIKFKSVHKNNHTLQQQSQLLLSEFEGEKDKKTNLRGQALGSLNIVPRGRRTRCN